MVCSKFLDKAKKAIFYDAKSSKFVEGTQGQTEFDVVWSSGPPPDRMGRDTCIVQLPLHLRREDPDGTKSIGHMLRDNLPHLIAIPQRFGLRADTFAWVTWPRTNGLRASEDLHIITKTSPLLSSHTSRRWHELEHDCRRGENTLGPGARGLVGGVYIVCKQSLCAQRGHDGSVWIARALCCCKHGTKRRP